MNSPTRQASIPLAEMPHDTSTDNISLIIIIDNPDFVDIKKMMNAVIIAYTNWSGYSKRNYSECVKLLNEINYKGEIYQLNMNNATEEFQLNTFNRLCEGWGEIFVIKHGNIIESFFGRDCLNDFRIKTENNLLLK